MPEKLPFRDMEGEDLATTVLTCEGDIRDPLFHSKLEILVNKLQNLISDEENPIKVTKVEPWNSVRVTFNIPLEAAQRLRQLAERGDRVLRELGILSVQIEGDQVITLTLASQYSEPQEIVLRKTSDEQGDVASVSFNLPNSEPVPGPSSAEPAHKNITQFLGHIVGGATAAASAVGSSTRLEKVSSPQPDTSISFRSPNVIAPSSTEPIPFPPAAVITTTAVVPSSSKVSPNVSVKSSAGFGPFPFASMTHAMNTKNSATSPQYQPVLLQGGNPRISFTSSAAQLSTAILNSSCSAVTATSTVSSKASNPALQKVPRTIANSTFNNVVSRTVPPNAIASTSRANVALSSPLLVNLLQSEASNLQQNNKLMPPPSQASNQPPKRKRKPRKSKDKLIEDGNVSSPNFSASPSPPSFQSHVGVRSPGGFDPLSVLGQPLSVPISNLSISPPSSQIANIHPLAQGQPPVSNIKPQTSIHPQVQGLPPVSLQSQIQGQPMVSTNRPLSHQTLSAFRQTPGHRAVPNIHPQAQGQPQVHTGNLPLHTHIPVGAPQVARPPTGSLQSYAMSAPRNIPINPSRSLFSGRDSSSLMKIMDKASKDSGPLKCDKSSAPSTPSTSTPDSNPFPSPPSSTDGKTKHLINPVTGKLEPMPSDEEEEEESLSSLPPFPEFENDTSEKSHSERSFSDGGKDTNHSSDTDSGISKSITDVSQSSTDALIVDSGKDKKNESTVKVDSVPSASVTSSVPGEKIKLRLKLDSKTIRESKDNETKEKRVKDSNPPLNQKIDVAVVSIPGLKKGTTTTSSSSVPEPRVPPLHISLRGPNAAVVVSPRKDDSKSRYALNKEDHPSAEVPCKVNQKKVRSPRSARAGDVALSVTGRTLDSLDRKVKGNNPKDFKKVKDFWNQSVKSISMSGGGIVEVSEKISSNRISSYDTYISGTSVSNPVVQRKSSNIFSLAARDSCKPEIMTLTSCSTGESVTLHTFAGSKSPLPLQVAAVSETEVLPADVSRSVNKDVSSSVSDVAMSVERTESADLGRVNNPPEEKLCEISLHVGSLKDNSFPSSRKSPLMQNNYLPHSPSAPDDSKNSVHKNSCPSEQTQSQSASSLVSTVPLSVNSASSPTCNTNETASGSNVQMQVSDSTDANKLLKPERVTANPVEDVSSSTDSQKQCNTYSINKDVIENILDNVNVDKNVQSDKIAPETNSRKDIITVNEVQNVDVNINATANKKDVSGTELSEDVKIDPSLPVTSKVPSSGDGDKCKNILSNHSDSCDLSVSCLTPAPKKEIKDDIDVSDKSVCVLDVKNPPIAQIISVDTLPIQPHVIEVPSLQTSPAVPNMLAKSGRATEVNSIPPVVPSCGTFLPARNVLVVQEKRDISICEGRVSPDTRLANVITVASHTEKFPILSLPCNTDKRVKLLNHINTALQDPSLNVKESPCQSSSVAPSEESNIELVEEERKRCMQLSEVPTSTPGPPVTESVTISSSSLSKTENISADDNNSAASPIVKEVLKFSNKESISQKPASKELPVDGCNKDDKKSKSFSPVPFNSSLNPDSTVTSDVQAQTSASSNVSSSKILVEEKSSCVSSENSVPSVSVQTSIQKENHSESNTSTATSESSTTPLVTVHSSGSSLGIESRTISIKQEVKKEALCTESVHVVSTSSNPVVTSLLSPVKYLPSEVSSQKFKLIFKGGGQRSTLQGTNSPTSLVVPLNSSKTVPIKLVTLPGGASALSVRSTSNPNIVEIIGPKTASSQNSPTSGNPHSSSPVRLVVSKVSPGLTCTNQSGSASMRNRVVVKSVVVTGTSPSIKLVSANTLCTTSVLSSSSASTTSSGVQNVSSASTSNSTSSHNFKLLAEELKPMSAENSTTQSVAVSCTSDRKIVGVETNSFRDTKETSVSQSLLNSSSTSTVRCSSSADSTTKDTLPPDSSCKISSTDSLCKQPANADSSTFKFSVAPDTTSQPSTDVSVNTKITSSVSHTSVKLSSLCPPDADCVSSENTGNSESNQCDNEIDSKKSTVADTTTEHIASEVSSVLCPEKPFSNNEIGSSSNCTETVEITDLNNKQNNSCVIGTEANERTFINSSTKSDDSIKSEQTADSAITTSLNYISNELESSDVADSSLISTPPSCSENSENEVKLQQESLTPNADTNVDNCVGIEDPCVIENEVTIASNIEEVSETSEGSDLVQNRELECNDVLGHSFGVESAQNDLCQDTEVVIQAEDTDSLDAKCNKFRPLGDESIDIVDSVDLDGAKVVEDSQLEISLVYSKPLKRKCSENAAELIKACMGVEDGPKRGVVVKTKSSEEIIEKIEHEKLEENVRMSLRIRRDDSILKKSKGSTLNSDCSTDEDITLSELVTKARPREKPSRSRISNRESPIEPNNCRPGRRRSGSNESHHSEEIKTRTSRENKRETNKKDEPSKKMPERTKRGTFKAQDQVVVSKVGIQRSSRIRDSETKPSTLNNNKEESVSLGAKRKTRGTTDTQEMLVQVKRRRYSKDGHR